MRTYEEPEFVWETTQIENMNTEIGQGERIRLIINSIKNLNTRLELIEMDLRSIKKTKEGKIKNDRNN